MRAPSLDRAFHVFFSVGWGPNHHNHARVRRIYERLRQLRHPDVWFDEVHMQREIDEAMCNGIVESEIFAAFITERYLQKVTGENATDMDYCMQQFIFAKQKLGPQKMLCIVMEK